MERIYLAGAGLQQNTGKFAEYFDSGLFRRAFLVPWDWKCEFNAEDTQQDRQQKLRDALSHALTANDYKDRAQQIGPFEGLDDKSTQGGTQTLGYGLTIDTSKGTYAFDFSYIDGGLDHHMKVQAFNGKTRKYKIVFMDERGFVMGTHYYDEDQKIAGMQGLEMSRFKAHEWKLPGKDVFAGYMLSIGLRRPEELNRNICVVDAGEDFESFIEDYQVQDVQFVLTEGSNVHFTALIGGLNMVAALPEIFSIEMLKCTNAAGGEVDILSVVPSGNVVAVGLDESDPQYLGGEKGYLEFNKVSTLAEAGFKYYAVPKKMEFTFE